ncbi:MAG: sulfite exporter TauE/SafE family protein [Candidatus Aminicenantaceae bacterium]
MWFDLSLTQWLVLIGCSLLIGMAKAGIQGTGLMMVPIMAYVFGGRPSTGLVLPMLIFADIFAVRYYNRHAQWGHIFRLIPWAVVGVLVGVFVGARVSEAAFKTIMGIIIFIGIAVMIWRDLRKLESLPDRRWTAPLTGTAGGFATMMGNAAGPIMSLYLLAMRLPKLNFIGTAAWFFFLVNVFKVPFHVLSWKTISLQTLALNLAMAPPLIGGLYLGIKIVKVIPEKAYRILVIVTTATAAAFLLR